MPDDASDENFRAGLPSNPSIGMVDEEVSVSIQHTWKFINHFFFIKVLAFQSLPSISSTQRL